MCLEVQHFLVLRALLVHQGCLLAQVLPVLHVFQVHPRVQHPASRVFQVALLVLES